MRRPAPQEPSAQPSPRPRARPLPAYRRRTNFVADGIRFMGTLAAVLVVLCGIIGTVLLVLGGLAGLEANVTGPNSILKVFVSADLWVRKAHAWVHLTPVKLWGSYALALGARVIGFTLASAVMVDIMLSLRRPG
ncbi:MAG: hypothetical protein OEO83_15245 [Alphaproteobacteria bacterium]|nr:hypothetical protein [Alphaproteobacteria bacterium]